jgi:serine/threonine-protein kinase RIO1
MHKRIKQLAEFSGFVMWDDGTDRIDWASEYDKEFEKFVDFLIRDVVDMQKNGTNVLKFFDMKKTEMANLDVTFDKDSELELHRMARERGITLDKLIEHTLVDYIIQQNKLKVNSDGVIE